MMLEQPYFKAFNSCFEQNSEVVVIAVGLQTSFKKTNFDLVL